MCGNRGEDQLEQIIESIAWEDQKKIGIFTGSSNNLEPFCSQTYPSLSIRFKANKCNQNSKKPINFQYNVCTELFAISFTSRSTITHYHICLLILIIHLYKNSPMTYPAIFQKNTLKFHNKIVYKPINHRLQVFFLFYYFINFFSCGITYTSNNIFKTLCFIKSTFLLVYKLQISGLFLLDEILENIFFGK